MKIKFIIAPALIVFIIIMLIWYIYPAYTNGVDGVAQKFQKLTRQKELNDKLDKNTNNMKSLIADMETNSSQDAIIFNYIPEDREEEKIIENLNSLAQDSSLSVIKISLSEKKDATLLPGSVSADQLSADPLVVPTTPNASAVPINPVTPKAKPNKLEVELIVVGDYGNIKNLLGKIQKLKRFNQLSLLEIEELAIESGEGNGSLQANITLEFDYLGRLKKMASGDVDNEVFSRGTFNRAVAEKIKDNLSIELNNVSLDQRGKSNPFAKE